MQQTLLSCAIRGVLAPPPRVAPCAHVPSGLPARAPCVANRPRRVRVPAVRRPEAPTPGRRRAAQARPRHLHPVPRGFPGRRRVREPTTRPSVQTAIVLARLAGWKLAVWSAPDNPAPPRPRYRPPPPPLLRKPEKEATDATIRATALTAHAMSEADATIIARADRAPCLLEFGGRRATKAAVLA